MVRLARAGRPCPTHFLRMPLRPTMWAPLNKAARTQAGAHSAPAATRATAAAAAAATAAAAARPRARLPRTRV